MDYVIQTTETRKEGWLRVQLTVLSQTNHSAETKSDRLGKNK